MTQRLASLILVLFSLLCLNSCRQQSEVLRIAAGNLPGYALLYLAQEKGFFLQQGLQVQLQDVASMGDAMRALETGKVDLATGSNAEIATLSSRKVPLLTIWVSASSIGANQLIAQPDIPYVHKLKGMRIAIEPDTSDLLVILAALKKAGLTLNDVALFPMPQSSAVPALTSQQVDAIPLHLANAGQLGEYMVNNLFDTSQQPELIVNMIYGRAELKRRPDILQRFQQAMIQADDFYHLHRLQADELLSQRLAIPAAHYQQAMTHLRRYGMKDQSWLLQADIGLASRSIVTARQMLGLSNSAAVDNWVYASSTDLSAAEGAEP